MNKFTSEEKGYVFIGIWFRAISYAFELLTISTIVCLVAYAVGELTINGLLVNTISISGVAFISSIVVDSIYYFVNKSNVNDEVIKKYIGIGNKLSNKLNSVMNKEDKKNNSK